ncbi:MAG: hypothetical protein AB8F26_01060 [Phycisphaerales bacterium]
MKIKTMVATFALFAAPALADSVDLDFQQVAGGSGAADVRIGSETFQAGHMVHTITSGPNAGSSFSTFCIELAELAVTGSATYQVVDLADAPAPGVPYGQAVADDISAIVANAAALGWIGTDLQADSNQTGFTGKMGAIQAAIWEAVGGDVNINSSQTSDELAFYYTVLLNGATFDDSLRVSGLRALVAVGQQDMLYIVPLPPAALAGAGLLLGIGGLRVARRR